MSQQVQLSVAIITLNEEKHIGRCIDSVRPVADEVVVVDSLSTDRTRQISEEKRARFIEQPFLGYAEQKNFAVEQTSNRHVLALDADECLSPRLVQQVDAVKNDWSADGFTMNRANNYYGTWIKYSGLYPNRKLRLWDREKGAWHGAYVHEKVVMRPDARVRHLDGDLLHYAYGSIESHVRQINSFSTLAAQKYHEDGKRGTLLDGLVHPTLRFVRDYFLRLGFLDGYHGFCACSINAHMTFLKYAKLRELQKAARRSR
jgi:glycosyltransferase involved in cell wall biosynthesis